MVFIGLSPFGYFGMHFAETIFGDPKPRGLLFAERRQLQREGALSAAHEGGALSVCLTPPKGKACRRAWVGTPFRGMGVASKAIPKQTPNI